MDKPAERADHVEVGDAPKAVQVLAEHHDNAAQRGQRGHLAQQHLGHRPRLLLHRCLAQRNTQQGRKKQKYHSVYGVSLCHDRPQ